ncbi:MAG: 4Fe-4S dicluster domain-containing protein [Planctomycetaceae bacterium]|nr:4Fe-4S dicluster domain-containing protein [Planctomycetaceae bacterium]
MVVTEPCFGCKYTDCVVVCPAECFHEGQSMVFIDPEECIDCGACVPECPVEAIFYEDDVPNKWHGYIELNREMVEQCPQISEKQPPLRL